MCDYCFRQTENVASVHLRQTDGKWTEKVYQICQSCKEYLGGVYKYSHVTDKVNE